MSWPGVPNIITNVTNATVDIPAAYNLPMLDGEWILTASFMIFTMQTGFALLESGAVSTKNEVNIMMKNIVDVLMGGFCFWFCGFGMAYGRSGELTNPFIGIGDYLLDPPVLDPLMGPIIVAFVFQVSYANTATTIVSGAMAERINFRAYCLFSLLNTIIYSISAGWVWGDHGFLHKMGVVDIAGSGPVHIVGGTASIAAAILLGPRLGRYDKGRDPIQPGNSVNVIVGLFILWWAWLAFNGGSVYGITGGKWWYAAKAIAMTLMSSIGGGIYGLVYSMIRHKGKVDVMELVNAVLAGLVAVSGGCFLYHSYAAILIGAIAAALALFVMQLLDRIQIDDPLGACAVHTMGGLWGVIAVGLFAQDPIPIGTTNGRTGLFEGGGWELLGIQATAALSLAVWGSCATFILVWCINKITPLRMDPEEELLGADHSEHGVALKNDHEHHDTVKNTSKINTFQLTEVRHTNPENSGTNGTFTSFNQPANLTTVSHRIPDRSEVNLGYTERL